MTLSSTIGFSGCIYPGSHPMLHHLPHTDNLGTLRHIIGARVLQEVIERREEIAQSIHKIIDETWGVEVDFHTVTATLQSLTNTVWFYLRPHAVFILINICYALFNSLTRSLLVLYDVLVHAIRLTANRFWLLQHQSPSPYKPVNLWELSHAPIPTSPLITLRAMRRIPQSLSTHKFGHSTYSSASGSTIGGIPCCVIISPGNAEGREDHERKGMVL
jgi:hypothetical protein